MRHIATLTRLAVRRSMVLLSRRAAHGHEVINPGPPVTLDYMPVPFKPYKSAYNELQAKFNMYLGVSVALLTTALALAFAEDLFSADALRPPLSYRLRNK